MLFCGQCKQGNKGQALNVYPPRNINFQFSVTQGIIVEAGDNYFRFLVSGNYITETQFVITNVTTANPAVVTAPGNDFNDGDEVFLAGINYIPQLNGRSFEVANVSGDTFTLVNVLDGTAISSADLAPYVSGGTAARIYTLATPYAAVDLPYLKWAQSADVMSLTLVNFNTGTSYPPYDLARIASAEWTLTETTFQSAIGPPAAISLAVNASSGTANFYYSFLATAIDASTGEESIASPIGVVAAVDIASQAGTINIYCSAVAGAGSYNFYAAPATYGAPPSQGALFGYLGSAFGPSFSDTNVVPDFSTGPPIHSDPFATSSVTGTVITNPGSGYSATAAQATVASPIGQNASLTPVVVNGQVVWIAVNSGGAGYTGGEAIHITDVTNSGVATGYVEFVDNPNPGDTITLNSVTWSFTTSVTTSQQTLIAGSTASTVAALAGDLGASGNALLTVASYVAAAQFLEITYKTAGTVGNTFSLAASAAIVSGPDLTGGGAGGGATAGIQVGPATGTYPSVVSYFQQRRVYAGTLNNPETYYMSQPGAFQNMDVSNPTVDSDAIIGTPWSQQVNGIQWMLNMPGGLVIFTGLGAWQVSGAGGGLATSAAITPADQVANPQAYNGCSPTVPPIPINYDILYVQEKGSIVRDLSYNFFVNIYTGTDMTVLSNHLFDGYTILQWGWAEEPNKLLWAIRNDGILLCLTYLKEQDVYAWTRHDTNGLFMSVAVVSEPPVNAPYFIVQRLIQNDGNPVWAYYQERMDNRLWLDQEDSWCVDAGLSLPQNSPNATLTVTSAAGIPRLVLGNPPSGVLYGGSGYSVATYAEVIDTSGTGPGAIAAVTIGSGTLSGVVISASIGGQLDNYTTPVFNIIDPAGTGGGAVVEISSPAVTFVNASAPVFADVPGQGEPGDIIRMGGRTMEVLLFLSSTQLLCQVLRDGAPPIPDDPLNTATPATAGNWTIAFPVTGVHGLDHLEGMTVSILADGVVVEPQVVAGGAIELPVAATQVTVGLGFTCQLQTLYLDIPGPATVQGRRKLMDSAVVRMATSGFPFEIGANQIDAATQPGQTPVAWTNLAGVQGPPSSLNPQQPSEFYSGDCFVDLIDAWTQPGGQIAIQQTAPVPLNVLALICSVRMGDDPDAE
jgi:hypothetical protein